MQFGTGQGRTSHVVVKDHPTRAVCGAMLTADATEEEIESKPICRACAKKERIPLCPTCHGTGQAPRSPRRSK